MLRIVCRFRVRTSYIWVNLVCPKSLLIVYKFQYVQCWYLSLVCENYEYRQSIEEYIFKRHFIKENVFKTVTWCILSLEGCSVITGYFHMIGWLWSWLFTQIHTILHNIRLTLLTLIYGICLILKAHWGRLQPPDS